MRRVATMAVVVVVALVAVGCFKPFDFDNDDRADFVVVAPSGAWVNLAKSPADPPLYGGSSADQVVPGDYDGNGSFDAATVTSTGDWITQTAGTINFPKPAQLPGYGHPSFQMIAVPADYDGDRKTDPAWYRDTDGTWFIKGQSTSQFGTGPTAVVFGPGVKSNDLQDQDFPTPADYDGDGKADLSTFNPRTRVWKVKSSQTGAITSVTIGGANDVLAFPAPGHYDGTRLAQRATYSHEGWRIDGHASVDTFGQFVPSGLPGQSAAAYPAAADYDGDGKTDLSYVSSSGTWNTRSSAAPATTTSYSIGGLGTTGASRAVAFTSNASVARFMLIARNCAPTNPDYAIDC